MRTASWGAKAGGGGVNSVRAVLVLARRGRGIRIVAIAIHTAPTHTRLARSRTPPSADDKARVERVEPVR